MKTHHALTALLLATTLAAPATALACPAAGSAAVVSMRPHR